MGATGYAPWTKVAGVGQYGVTEQLADYLDLGEPDAQDSLSAASYKALALATAQTARQQAFLIMHLTGQDTLTIAPLVRAWMMGADEVSYLGTSPPTNFPEVTWVNTGRYRITLPAVSYTDEAGVASPFELAFLRVSSAAPSATGQALGYISSSTVAVVQHLNWQTASYLPDESLVVRIG